MLRSRTWAAALLGTVLLFGVSRTFAVEPHGDERVLVSNDVPVFADAVVMKIWTSVG